MLKWWAGAGLCLAMAGVAWAGQAAQDEAAKANELYQAGKRVDALPLYENLAKNHPDEMLYQERLADCLSAAETQVDDPAQKKVLMTQERDAAKRAVALGDKTNFIQDIANMNPDAPATLAQGSPAQALMAEGEKAFTAGDYPTAFAKYVAAADADPRAAQERAQALRGNDLRWSPPTGRRWGPSPWRAT